MSQKSVVAAVAIRHTQKPPFVHMQAQTVHMQAVHLQITQHTTADMSHLHWAHYATANQQVETHAARLASKTSASVANAVTALHVALCCFCSDGIACGAMLLLQPNQTHAAACADWCTLQAGQAVYMH